MNGTAYSLPSHVPALMWPGDEVLAKGSALIWR